MCWPALLPGFMAGYIWRKFPPDLLFSQTLRNFERPSAAKRSGTVVERPFDGPRRCSSRAGAAIWPRVCRPDEEPRIADQAEKQRRWPTKGPSLTFRLRLRMCWPALLLGFMAGLYLEEVSSRPPLPKNKAITKRPSAAKRSGTVVERQF